MQFMMFLAVPGLVVSSFLVAFGAAGIWETDERGRSARIGRATAPPLFAVACTSLILIEPAAISPAWLQYTVLLGIPAMLGLVVRRLIATSWSRRNANHHE